MKLKLLLSGAFLLLSAMTANAVPAKPVKKTVRQADGTVIELTLRGDEHFSYYTDAEGTPYLLHADGRLERKTRQEVSDTWNARRAERLSVAGWKNQTRSLTRAPWQVGRSEKVTVGKHRGLVILVQFPDFPFASEDPQAEFNRYFNEEGYTEYGNAGSVRDYFLKQSYGQLEIDFDVVGPYTTLNKLSYYGENVDGHDANPAKMVTEAVDAAAADVNYADYDWDEDGEVDQIFIICAGYDEAEGADPKYIWPHEWKLSGQGIERKYNGKVLNTYGVSTELWGSDNSNPNKEISGIGTACHEFSHCLGLPDFYDTSTDGHNFGMGYWDVMCAGNYNDNSKTPAAYTSFERMYAGWLTPTELKEMTRIEGMKPLEESKDAYILYNDNNRDEYYLLENRQLVGFDAGLYGHGLLVLHVYYDAGSWRQNTVNTVSAIQRMTIIPADGKQASNVTSLAGDPFPGTSGNASLTNYTSPAATLYTNNADGTKLMSKPIDNIRESEDGLISFVACRPEMSIPEPDGGTATEGKNEFTVTWPAVPGAISYELELTEVGKASDDPSEALEKEFTFDEFVSSSSGLTDISSTLVDYGYSGWTGSKLYTSPNKLRIGTSKEAGKVRTPTWYVPQSAELTVVIGAQLYKEGTPVKGRVRAAFGNNGENATYDDVNFELTEDGMMLFHYSIRKDFFWLVISSETSMYLNYLAVYDGLWNAEQLGITAKQYSARMAGPKKATTITNYTSETNSYTFTDVNRNSRFFYRVRALGEENTYSLWSEEKAFSFSGADGIGTITAKKDAMIYDLNGRRRGTDAAVLPKGIYIIDGKKVVVK